MDRNSLEQVARRWIEEIWRPGDRASFDDLHAPAGRGETRDGFRRMLSDFYAAFPDFHTEIEDLVTDEALSTARTITVPGREPRDRTYKKAVPTSPARTSPSCSRGTPRSSRP
jgi:hypothetical protein